MTIGPVKKVSTNGTISGAQNALWLGVRATDAEPFFPYFRRVNMVSLDYSVEADRWRGAGRTIFSAEEKGGKREQWYSGELDQLLKLDELENSEHANSSGDFLIPFAVTECIADFAQKNGYKLLAPNPNVRTQLEDKIALIDVVKSLGLPTLASIVVSPDEANFHKACGVLKAKVLVAQTKNSASGSGTFLIRDEKDLLQALRRIPPQDSIKISPYVPGPVASISCVVTENAPIIGPITRQVVNIPELAPAWGVYSGNIFYDFEWAKNTSGILSIGHNVSRYVSQLGFRGLLNLNILVEGPYLIDVNPRCMGHFRILCDIQRCCGDTSFALLHILSTLGELKEMPLADEHHTKPQMNASLIVMHSLAKSYVKVSGSLDVGVYSISKTGIQFLRHGNSVADLANESEVLILDPLPLTGTIIAPGAALCRVHTRGSLLEDSQTDILTQYGKDLTAFIYSRLALKAV